MNEPISSIMSTDLITIGPDDTLDKVRAIFLSKRIHHLPVVEAGMIVGLLTTYDLFKLTSQDTSLNKIQVRDGMTTKLAKLKPTAKIGTAAELFLLNLFHAIPVVDDDDKLLGLITSFDVLKYNFKKAYPNQEI